MKTILLIIILLLPATILFPQGLVNNGASIVATAGSYLVVSDGNWENNGTFAAGENSTVILRGNSPQTISGNVPTVFSNLKLLNDAGFLLSVNTRVAGVLDFESGIITTGDHIFSVGASGTIRDAGPSSYVNGKMSWDFGKSEAHFFPVGKDGIYSPLTFHYLRLTGESTVRIEHFDEPLTGSVPENMKLIPEGQCWEISQTGESEVAYLIIPESEDYRQVPDRILFQQKEQLLIADLNVPLHYLLKTPERFTLGKTHHSQQEFPAPEKKPISVFQVTAFPNPFSDYINFNYYQPVDGMVRFMVYDLLGKEVKEMNLPFMEKGNHHFRWTPDQLPDGLYHAIFILEDQHSESLKIIRNRE